jgi:hypothetical protein
MENSFFKSTSHNFFAKFKLKLKSARAAFEFEVDRDGMRTHESFLNVRMVFSCVIRGTQRTALLSRSSA